jgi:hypothetical protein
LLEAVLILVAATILGSCTRPAPVSSPASASATTPPSSEASPARYRIPGGFCDGLDYGLLEGTLGNQGVVTQGHTGIAVNFESTGDVKCSLAYGIAKSSSDGDVFLEVAVFTYESAVGSQLAYDTWPKRREGLVNGTLSTRVDQVHYVLYADSYGVFVRDANMFIHSNVLFVGGASTRIGSIASVRPNIDQFISHVVDRMRLAVTRA